MTTWPTTETEEGGDKKRSDHSSTIQKKMKLLRRQRPFLESIQKEANQNKRQQLLEHANGDQINSVSEMVLNLLKDRIPVTASTYGKLKRHKKVLRELGKRY